MAHLPYWLECPSPFNLGNFIKISKIGQASRKDAKVGRAEQCFSKPLVFTQKDSLFPSQSQCPPQHWHVIFLRLPLYLNENPCHKHPPAINRNLAFTLFTNGTHSLLNAFCYMCLQCASLKPFVKKCSRGLPNFNEQFKNRGLTSLLCVSPIPLYNDRVIPFTTFVFS